MKRDYRAAVFHNNGQLNLEKRSLPHRLDDNEVVIKVAWAGICRTDEAIYKGTYFVPRPLVGGHEFSGVVVRTGRSAEASGFMGQRVVSEITTNCVKWRRPFLCPACRRDPDTKYCQFGTIVGIMGHDGAFAEYVRVPVGCVHRLPDSIPLDVAVLTEPLASALHTFEVCPLEAHSTVVVLGCGRLGRLVTLAAVAKRLRVIAVVRDPSQLTPVLPLIHAGVCLVARNQREPREHDKKLFYVSGEYRLASLISRLTRTMGADMVVEATGSNQLGLAQKLVRPQGTIALKSIANLESREATEEANKFFAEMMDHRDAPAPAIDTSELARKEICVQPSHGGSFATAFDFMSGYHLLLKDWIGARFRLEDLDKVLTKTPLQKKALIELAGGE